MKRLILIEEAEQDVADAYAWYEQQRPGLEDECLAAIRRATALIEANPNAHPRVRGDIQRPLVKRFPYSILYREQSERLVDVAVVHARRFPDIWKRRV